MGGRHHDRLPHLRQGELDRLEEMGEEEKVEVMQRRGRCPSSGGTVGQRRTTIGVGVKPEDIYFEPDIVRRQDDFERWRVLGLRQWQGSKGLNAQQAANVGLYLRGMSHPDRGSMVANLAATFAKIMVDVTTLSANSPESEEPLSRRRPARLDDEVEVEISDEDSEANQAEPEPDLDSDAALDMADEEPLKEDQEDEEVRLMQHTIGLAVVTQMSMQLQALLKNLNALSPKEAHEKASAPPIPS